LDIITIRREKTEMRAQKGYRSKMAAVEPETTPNPQPLEEEKAEAAAPSQEVASPEQCIKHPLQNRRHSGFVKMTRAKLGKQIFILSHSLTLLKTFGLYTTISRWDWTHVGRLKEEARRTMANYTKQAAETLLCQSFDDYSDDVCGAAVNVGTKGDTTAIWTTECENRDAVTHIGRVYKERLGLPPKIVIGYQSHADTAIKSGSTTKNRFVL
uniref:Uncharacterized protein n=1 Tax=Melopsittacus undulatus TaxID=13146 RepID=A0A8V5HG41_MELUD